MLYKLAASDKSNIEYIIDVYEDEFNEDLLEEFLNNRANKRSILKSILVDKKKKKLKSVEENESLSTSPSFISSKQAKGNYINIKIFLIILKIDSIIYFIYEDDPSDQNYYDYNVIKMKKDRENKDNYIKDLISKLNDFQQAFTLTNFYSDDDSIYFFMNMPINMTPDMSQFI